MSVEIISSPAFAGEGDRPELVEGWWRDPFVSLPSKSREGEAS